MIQKTRNRRELMRSLFLSTAAVPILLSNRTLANPARDTEFQFEVTRTELEWRARLSGPEFDILRGGATELPKSSPLWEETRAGHYSCRGCDLTLFDAYWKIVLETGWVFFRQSEPNGVLTGIDRSPYSDLLAGGPSMPAPELTEEEARALDTLAGVEAHCRRCGSHLGHVICYNSTVLYCINGAALDFAMSEA